VHVGPVVPSAVDRDGPRALIDFGLPLAVHAAVPLPATARARNDRASASQQDDGRRWTAITPVASLHSPRVHDCLSPLHSEHPEFRRSNSRAVFVHHTPDDPAGIALHRTPERRQQHQSVTFSVLTIVVQATTAVAGMLFLL
jgi:hypothetical protein